MAAQLQPQLPTAHAPLSLYTPLGGGACARPRAFSWREKSRSRLKGLAESRQRHAVLFVFRSSSPQKVAGPSPVADEGARCCQFGHLFSEEKVSLQGDDQLLSLLLRISETPAQPQLAKMTSPMAGTGGARESEAPSLRSRGARGHPPPGESWWGGGRLVAGPPSGESGRLALSLRTGEGRGNMEAGPQSSAVALSLGAL